MLYFSGTGNSKYIAESFCRHMNAECYSIEENINFEALMKSDGAICFCYPIYGSRVPRIMREFAIKHMEPLKGKKIIIICTQLLFSGDGARAFTDIFPRDFIKVIYAEHFLMPNNVCNVSLVRLANERKIKKYMLKAERKMQSVCNDITNGIVKQRGFNIISRILGLPQGVLWPLFEKRVRDSVRISASCTQCGLCESVCPMDNLKIKNGKTEHKHNCIVCYRCVNQCPEKAITVVFHGKVRNQYKGVSAYIRH
jgi:NAD-dependent dihydropyrimidine dehydrogenase PreA subunit